jgi:hypothetical protein
MGHPCNTFEPMLGSHGSTQVPNLGSTIVGLYLRVFLAQVSLLNQPECLRTPHNSEGNEVDLKQIHIECDFLLHNLHFCFRKNIDLILVSFELGSPFVYIHF